MGHLRAAQSHHIDYYSKVNDSTADGSYGDYLGIMHRGAGSRVTGRMDNEDHEICIRPTSPVRHTLHVIFEPYSTLR